MSQLATAYVLDDSLLSELHRLVKAKKWWQFWSTKSSRLSRCWSILHKSGPDLMSSFDYSGSVFLALHTFLSDRGINLPFAEGAKGSPFEGLAMQMLLSADECAEFRKSLESLQVTEQELSQYWQEFHGGEEWPEAGVAVESARQFLILALAECTGTNKLFFDVGY